LGNISKLSVQKLPFFKKNILYFFLLISGFIGLSLSSSKEELLRAVLGSKVRGSIHTVPLVNDNKQTIKMIAQLNDVPYFL
jgi:hypothetical protein